MTKEELQNHFRAYLDQVPILLSAKAYWALLHYIIIFPDICAALESDNGETNGDKYKKWAKQYLATGNFNEKEWWKLRCSLLHQGKTLGDQTRYANFSFSQPDDHNGVFHKNTHSDGSFNLDIGKLTDEMLDATDSWFDYIVANPTSAASQNVEKNIVTLSQPRDPKDPFGGDVTGLNMSVSASPNK